MKDVLDIRKIGSRRDVRLAYLESQVQESQPEELLLLLYEGLTRYVLAGKTNLEEKNWEEATENLGRARRIVNYLIQLLRPEGGDITRHLRRLYAFCFDRISHSILERDPEFLDGVLQVIGELSGAWNELTRTKNKE
jgi:flagellar secretion chaperone FliS